MDSISLEPLKKSDSSLETHKDTIIRIKEDSADKVWSSCCFRINTNATKYFVQVGILSTLIVYSATMLVVNQSCESQRNYGSLLMVTLGVFLPQPRMN